MPKKPSAPRHSLDSVGDILLPGQSIELLKELHILTRDGRLNQDTRRKLKQVHHLFGFIKPLLQDLEAAQPQGSAGITLADHGAGKSYLGFILYDLFFRERSQGTIYGIETRQELVDRSAALAQRLGFARMRFLALSSEASAHTADLPQQMDVVTALHACDTATDDAIAFGLHKQARHMVLVPCCQAEAAAHLRQSKALQLARTPLAQTVAAPAAHPRNGQPDHQCHALPVSGVARLPRHGHRTGRLGTQPEKRADSRQLQRPEKTQRRPTHAGAGRILRAGKLAATTLSASVAGGLIQPRQIATKRKGLS